MSILRFVAGSRSELAAVVVVVDGEAVVLPAAFVRSSSSRRDNRSFAVDVVPRDDGGASIFTTLASGIFLMICFFII